LLNFLHFKRIKIFSQERFLDIGFLSFFYHVILSECEISHQVWDEQNVILKGASPKNLLRFCTHVVPQFMRSFTSVQDDGVCVVRHSEGRQPEESLEV